MTSERWKKIERICRKAIHLDKAQRSAYLDKTCQGDSDLRREVESLLATHDKSGNLLGIASSVGGKVLGHYQVIDLIGEGGMALVYQARDIRLGRLVALKVLHPWAIAHPEAQQRLMREAKAASALNHPNIVTVHEFAEDGNFGFIVMEHVAGKTLNFHTPAKGLAADVALNYALQIVDALTAAHGGGVLHRDLKPTNIMVTKEDRVKLLDFGLAEAWRSSPDETSEIVTSHSYGTRAYMSPEQVQSPPMPSDQRSEIFSFGLILSEMLSGRHPFGPGTPEEIAKGIREEAPRSLPPWVPALLVAIVERCLEKDPKRRFQSMQDVFAALKECEGKKAAGDHDDAPMGRQARRARRPPARTDPRALRPCLRRANDLYELR